LSKKIERMTTPIGVAKYPRLVVPNTKFNPDGEYQVTLIISVDEAAELMSQLDQKAQEAYDEAVQDLKDKKKHADANKVIKNEPYSIAVDEEGNETGDVEFKFRMKAKITKDDKVYTFAPKLYNKNAEEIKDKEGLFVGSGSTMRVNFSTSPYYVAGTRSAGVSLKLNAVQLIDIVSGGDATSFGFSDLGGNEEVETGGEDLPF
jgi:hypothetical protein